MHEARLHLRFLMNDKTTTQLSKNMSLFKPNKSILLSLILTSINVV